MTSAARSLFALLCLLHVPDTSCVADAPRYIGPHGSPEHLILIGCSKVPAGSIRQGLLNDTEFQLHCRPTTYWSTWRRVLGQRLALGYQRAGFPDAEIHVAWDDARSRPTVRIVEGPRSFCGPMTLEAPAVIDQQVVLARLRAPTPQFTPVSGMSPVGQPGRMWTEGQPAACDAITAQRRNERIEQALAELGFFFPTVSSRILHEPQGGPATLVVEVQDYGPPGIVQDIRINGLLRNEASEVRALCGIQSGQKVTLHDLQAARQRLNKTGRFWTVAFRPSRGAGDEGIQLDIQAIEYFAAPKLADELTEVQQALVRVAEWVNRFTRSEDDLVVRMNWKSSDGPLKLLAIASPQDGWLLKATGAWHGLQFDHALVVEHNRQSLYSLRTGRWFEAVDVDMQPGLQLMMHPSVNPETREWQSRLVFGLGAGNQHGGQGLQCEAIPVCFIRESIKHADRWQLNASRLEYQAQDLRIQFDAESGRLIEAGLDTNDMEIRVHLAGKALRDTLAEVSRRCPVATRVQSITTFTVQELTASAHTGARIESLDAAALGVVQSVLKPVDEMIASRLSPSLEAPERRFWIPTVTHGPQAQTMDLVAVIASNLADTLFSAGSWPWTLIRETTYSAAGISGSFPQLQTLMQSPEALGPVGFVLVGSRVRQFSPSTAAQFLSQGRSRLHIDDFRNDLEALLTGHAPMAAAIAEASERFQKLDDADFAALVQGSPSSWAPVLHRLDAHIRQPERTAAVAGLLNAARELWTPCVEPRLKAYLQPALAAEPDSTRQR